MSFNPKDYLIDLKGKKYLQVAHRVEWFRETYPVGAIVTELVNVEPIVFKATVTNNEGVVLAVDYASATPKQGAIWSGREIEKASTAAIGRALALAGFGTQFTDDFEDADGGHLADSPLQSQNGNGHRNGNGSKASDKPIAGTSKQTVLVGVEHKTDKKNKPFMSFEAEDGSKIAVYSSQMFKDAGYAPDGFTKDWRVSVPIPVRLVADDKGYWQLHSIVTPEPESEVDFNA
jgi:hypothetical protein